METWAILGLCLGSFMIGLGLGLILNGNWR